MLALRTLNLHGCWLLRSSTLAGLLAATPQLQSLNLSFCARALSRSESSAHASPHSEEVLELIAGLDQLSLLDLTNCDLSDAAINRLCSGWTRRMEAERAKQVEEHEAAAAAAAASAALSTLAIQPVAATSTAVMTSAAVAAAPPLPSSRLPPLPPPALRSLNLSNNPSLSNASLSAFHSVGLQLHDLCVYGVYRLDDKGLLNLSYKHLKRLCYSGCYRVSESLKRYLFSSNPSLLLYNQPQQFGTEFFKQQQSPQQA